MENKSNILATVVGAIVILLIFIGASFFIGQKIKEKFYRPQVVKTTTTVVDEPSTNLLTEEKSVIPGNYTIIPQTGPESLALLFLPLIGTAGIYLKSKSAS